MMAVSFVQTIKVKKTHPFFKLMIR
jgi:hypothetical protein